MRKAVLLAARMVQAQTSGTLIPLPFCLPLRPSPPMLPSLFLFLSPRDHPGTFSSPSLGLLRASCTCFPLRVFSRTVYSEYTYHVSLCKTPLSSAPIHKRTSLISVYWIKPNLSDAYGSWSASCWPVQG